MTRDTHTPEPRDDGASPRRDELLLQRLLDGELRATEAVELERRLAADPALAARRHELEGCRALFAADAEADAAPPLALDFADRVLAATRAVPEAAGRSLRPWLLVAAALLLALLVGHLLTRPSSNEEMQADPREGARILEELDRRVEARRASVAEPRPDAARGAEPGAQGR
ncbi:MAG: hypothetical protein R3F30_00850 [Planctomycetota bacterium]